MTTTQKSFHIVTEDGETFTVDALPMANLVHVRRVSQEGDELDEMFLYPNEVRTFVLALTTAANILDSV